jgi:hypothetical protein
VHRLTSSFVLAYHGCDRAIADLLLSGEPPTPSHNSYDWLGDGVYFWESNPLRALEFVREKALLKNSGIANPAVVGGIIELGMCLDLTTSSGVDWMRTAFHSLAEIAARNGAEMPRNNPDGLRRNLDRAVIQQLHVVLEESQLPPVDTVKGVFIEGNPIYPGSGFYEKTHIQIAVRNLDCIKGVFRVKPEELRSPG